MNVGFWSRTPMEVLGCDAGCATHRDGVCAGKQVALRSLWLPQFHQERPGRFPFPKQTPAQTLDFSRGRNHNTGTRAGCPRTPLSSLILFGINAVQSARVGSHD
jgi:hypothetical protein